MNHFDFSALEEGGDHLGGKFIALVAICSLVQDAIEAVIFALADGVVFMAMAFGATKGQAHPNLAGGIRTILHRSDAEFFIIGSTFGIGHGVAMEGSS